MKTAVIVFPGSNCDRDLAVALREVTGVAPAMVNVLIRSSLKYRACTGEYITKSWPSRSLRVS